MASDWSNRWKWQSEARKKPHLRMMYGAWWCAQNGVAESSRSPRAAYTYLMTKLQRARYEALGGVNQPEATRLPGGGEKAAGGASVSQETVCGNGAHTAVGLPVSMIEGLPSSMIEPFTVSAWEIARRFVRDGATGFKCVVLHKPARGAE